LPANLAASDQTLAEASRGADTVDVDVVLRMVLNMESVEYRPE
jgi:hypothetical protein